MSHISVIKTAFSDKAILLMALHELGYSVTESDGLSVTDGQRNCKVDLLVKLPYSDPVGFRKGKNGWQAVADWFRVLEDRKEFENRLRQQYAYLSVRQNLEQQGYQIAEEKRNEKGQIHLVLRRMS